MLSRTYACVSGRLGGSAELLLKHVATSQSTTRPTGQPAPPAPVQPVTNFKCQRFLGTCRSPTELKEKDVMTVDRSWCGVGTAASLLHLWLFLYSVSTLKADSSCRKKTVRLVILQKQPSVVKIPDLQYTEPTFLHQFQFSQCLCWELRHVDGRNFKERHMILEMFDIQN